MKIKITKGARKYGYIIWSKKNNEEMKKLLNNCISLQIQFNGLNIGEKPVDWKYYRISLGYKFTRALPQDIKYFNLTMHNGILEVLCTNE